jgi:predicted nucleic acid-binding protein
MTPRALTPQQQIDRLIKIAKSNPRARLVPALNEVRRGVVIDELRLAAAKKKKSPLDRLTESLRNLDKLWKGNRTDG